jgi:hypothetical protein
MCFYTNYLKFLPPLSSFYFLQIIHPHYFQFYFSYFNIIFFFFKKKKRIKKKKEAYITVKSVGVDGTISTGEGRHGAT